MIDPEEQLRRLAEWRSEEIGAYVPPVRPEPGAESDAEVIRFPWGRWVAGAVAAAVVLLGGLVAVVQFGDDGGSEEVVGPPPDVPSTSTSSTTTSLTPTTTRGDLIVPDVVGDDPDEATELLEEAGFLVRKEYFFTTPDDAGLGEITGQDRQPGEEVPPRSEIVIRIAQLPDQWANGRDRCARTPYLLGDLDGDARLDGVHPRRVDGVIRELEVCTANDTPWALDGLSLAGVEQVADLDFDGLAEIVAPLDGAGNRTAVLSLLDAGLVAVDGALSYGETVDGATTWWGCMAFPGGRVERLAVGDWTPTAEGGVEWQVTETWVQDGAFVTGRVESGTWDAEYVASLDGPATPPGRARCAVDPPSGSPCIVPGALVGDVDADGDLDAIAVREGLVCLTGGVTAAVGEATADATTWFLGDVEGDGRLELFLGTTTAYSTIVRPYAVTDQAELVPIGDEDLVQWVPEWAVVAGVEPRWFSCLPPTSDAPGRIVSGSFWVDADAGTVRWTVDGEFVVPSAVDEDTDQDGTEVGDEVEPTLVVHEALFDDPTATDAWIPGNGCNRAAWRDGRLDLDEDWKATPAALEALNSWLIPNDPEGVRRFLVVREALGIAADLLEASGPYVEDAEAGVIEVHGLHDDSVGAMRFDIALSEDRSKVVEVRESWRCARGADVTSWTTEPCP